MQAVSWKRIRVSDVAHSPDLISADTWIHALSYITGTALPLLHLVDRKSSAWLYKCPLVRWCMPCPSLEAAHDARDWALKLRERGAVCFGIRLTQSTYYYRIWRNEQHPHCLFRHRIGAKPSEDVEVDTLKFAFSDEAVVDLRDPLVVTLGHPDFSADDVYAAGLLITGQDVEEAKLAEPTVGPNSHYRKVYFLWMEATSIAMRFE